MDRRRIFAIFLLIIAVFLIVGVPVWLFTPLSAGIYSQQASLSAPPLAPIASMPLPRSSPRAGLVPRGNGPAILASEAILMDADTGTLLFEKKAENPVPMASTTKIMTALIVIQAGNLDQVITVGQDAVDEPVNNQGSSAFLQAGAQIKLRDLLYALMLPSGDDAAIAIADGLVGKQQRFVDIMNAEAQKLHLYQTHYSNADGLEYGVHYTTPYDLVRLARYAMTIPLFARIVSTTSYQPPAHTVSKPANWLWQNTNTMLTTYTGMLGIKTGWTGDAGGCLVFSARRNGHTLIGVVLHSSRANSRQRQDELTRFTDAKTLLDWGFSLPTGVSQV